MKAAAAIRVVKRGMGWGKVYPFLSVFSSPHCRIVSTQAIAMRNRVLLA